MTGGDNDSTTSSLFAVGERVRNGAGSVVLAVKGDLVRLSGKDGDVESADWFPSLDVVAMEAAAAYPG